VWAPACKNVQQMLPVATFQRRLNSFISHEMIFVIPLVVFLSEFGASAQILSSLDISTAPYISCGWYTVSYQVRTAIGKQLANSLHAAGQKYAFMIPVASAVILDTVYMFCMKHPFLLATFFQQYWCSSSALVYIGIQSACLSAVSCPSSDLFKSMACGPAPSCKGSGHQWVITLSLRDESI